MTGFGSCIPRGGSRSAASGQTSFVELADDVKDFVENGWVGHTLGLGDAVRLRITGPCPRCVMTTLPQSDLPKDPGILRTAALHNQVNVGVYASVVQGGTVRRGDAIRLDED